MPLILWILHDSRVRFGYTLLLNKSTSVCKKKLVLKKLTPDVVWLQGKALGRRCAVQFRAWTQKCLDRLALSIHRKLHIYFILLLLGNGVMLAGFKLFVPSSDFNQLWVECKLYFGFFFLISRIFTVHKLSMYSKYLWRVCCIAGGRLESEMRYTANVLGEKESVSHLLVMQKANEGISPEVPRQRLLHKKAFLAHLQVLRSAIRTTVTLYDV